MRDGLRSAARRGNARQRDVIARRYGLNEGAVQTLAEIAAELRITRERVRQIQLEALARLRRISAESSPPG